MLKAARRAQRMLRLTTANGVNRGSIVICSKNNEILKILGQLRDLASLGIPNIDPKVKALKKQLRSLQRLSMYNRCRQESINLSYLLYHDRNAFWRKISSFNKTSKKKASIGGERPTREDFLNFYSNLFSHSDRPSDQQHLEIESRVRRHSESLKNLNPKPCFRVYEISSAIEDLKSGKTPGIDNISNEFFTFGNCRSIVLLIQRILNAFYTSGILPSDFNTAILIPIPKSDKVSTPTDYRPISISTPLATIFEMLLLLRMPCLKKLSLNQFGYRESTSCKNAVFIANEVIALYERQGMNAHVVSLDAAKAFDKLWREGLFDKLLNTIEPAIWRLLFNYYSCSMIAVRVDGITSQPITTTQGIKQGGVISGYLFNFFMDNLITSCLALDLGACIGNVNLSCLAYCDDILLLSPVRSHMDKLLQHCFTYASRWKIKFNPSKSTYFSLKNAQSTFNIQNTPIPVVDDGFVYLGMPIGTLEYTAKHFSIKFAKVERAFYALRGIGCRTGMLDPKVMAFVYKQFCQSICRYGFENLFIDNKTLGHLNVRQSTLIKHAVGVGTRARTKPLLQVLGIEQVTQIYQKHKIYGIRQFLTNALTRTVFNDLKQRYSQLTPAKRSFFHQLKTLETDIDSTVLDHPLKHTFQKIDNLYVSNDNELNNRISILLSKLRYGSNFEVRKELQTCLKAF